MNNVNLTMAGRITVSINMLVTKSVFDVICPTFEVKVVGPNNTKQIFHPLR
ncbi:hypothetical protein AHF37_09526 [Paragonimus kellicotti]|nr:hypothetical protein AHF37_09526 [Paragonimus kellicotti]